MNKAGVTLLKGFENFKAVAYLDIVGVPTIGWGFTKGVKMGDTMTLEEANARLILEVAEFENGLKVEGTPNQLAAMTCLAYNIGLGNFGHSTVRRMHTLGNFQAAADAFRMWDMAGGRVVTGLVRRREAERALYLTPESA